MASEAVANNAQPNWELSKENFQPLKAGRRPAGLRDNTAELRKQLVEEQRRAFWDEIASYPGDDPLEVWLRFIKWTQETFAAGGHKAELLPLLERCTRELQSMPRYRGDVRYLRVWVQYADCLPDPGDVFAFLKENEIGQEHALYYIAFATYLEMRGSYAKADAVYQQGINRLAAPADRLRAKFAEFQHRMARRIQRKAQEQQAGAAEPEHPGRQTLGTIAARHPARGGLPGPAALKRKAGSSPPQAPGQENVGGGLSIFMDEEFQADAAPAQSAPAALFAPGRSAAGPWSKLGSFEQSRKENTQRPAAWAGQKLRQAPAHSAPPAPALEILVDPEFEEAPAPADTEHKEPTLRQRLERGGGPGEHVEEALATDPLRLHRAQPPAPAASQPVAPSRPALQPKEASDANKRLCLADANKRRREESMAFDEAALSEDGEELCFEELRARAWQSKRAAGAGALQLASTRYPQPEQEAAAVEVAANVEVGQQQEGQPVAESESPDAEQEALPEERQQIPQAPAAPLGEEEHPAIAQAPSTRGRPAQLYEPTMTIATRNAFAAINNMFQGSLPAEHAVPPPLHPASEPTLHMGAGGYEPTMTIATRNAFAAINGMFKGALPTEHGTLPPRAGPYEPTVTINTKAAFDAINSMFGGGGGAVGGSGVRAAPHDAAAGGPRRSRGAGALGAPCQEPTLPLLPRISSSSPFVLREGSSRALVREDTTAILVPRVSSSSPIVLHEMQSGPARQGGLQQWEQPQQQPAACGFSIREDTQFLGGPAAANAGFCIREDTQFVGAPSAGQHMAAGGFCVREDTQLMAVPPAEAGEPFPGGAGAFCIREDTQFVGAPVLGGGAAFCIPEDTQFLSVPVPAAAPGINMQGLHIHEDTAPVDVATADFAAAAAAAAGAAAEGAAGTVAGSAGDVGSAAQVNKWGFAPGCDDTLQLDLGGDTLGLGDTRTLLDAQDEEEGLFAALRQRQQQGLGGEGGQRQRAASLPSTGTGSGLTEYMRDLHLSEAEDKENLLRSAPPPRAALAPRSIRDKQAAAAALRPLGEGEGHNSDAEAQLAQQGLAEEDSFEVREEGTRLPPAADPFNQPAHPPAPGVVDPFDPAFQRGMLASLEPPVLQWPGVSGCSAAEEVEAAAVLKGVKRAAGSAMPGPAMLQLGGQAYSVSRMCGQGAYATVYQATDAKGEEVAIKHESPPCPWEWYICQALHARIPSALCRRFIDPARLVLGAGASMLVAPYGAGGSVQDLLNAYLRQGQRPDEVVAMHCAMELLRVLGGLAAARIVHADIKPDNLLVLVGGEEGEEGCDENAAPSVQLQLIDLGRSVDLELLPPGTLLQGDSGTDSFRCVEMREGQRWLHQADCYGVCGVVHCLLFGEYMEVERVADGEGNISLRLRQGWKRYWAQELWTAFFHALLNHTSPAAPPPAQQLLRRFEEHFAHNPAAARKLQYELRKVAAVCRS